MLWIAGSTFFSLYVSKFGNYDATYGSLGAVAILMLWLWLSALIVLLGATIDAEVDRKEEESPTAGGEDLIAVCVPSVTRA